MSMLLRSRRILSYAGKEEPREPGVEPVRRSTRLFGRVTYEDFDESDSARSLDMERDAHLPAEEDAEPTNLKPCSVVLDRLRLEDKAARREQEEREDMNRRGAKPVSRIPTFHKRPNSSSQSAEPSGAKKDSPVQSVHAERAASTESSKPRPPDVREKGPPPPWTHVPEPEDESHSLVNTMEELDGGPRGSMFFPSAQQPFLMASRRPAIRLAAAAAEDEEDEEEEEEEGEEVVEEKEQMEEEEQELRIDSEKIHEYLIAPPSHEPQEEKVQKSGHFTATASGDSAKSECADPTHENEDETIMDEEPPWSMKPIYTFEQKDSISSSDVDYEEDLPAEKRGNRVSLEVKEKRKQQLEQLGHKDHSGAPNDQPSFAGEPEKPTNAASIKCNQRSRCSSFLLSCFLPMTMLLLSGVGLHVWQYGLPLSVEQLATQLELHWLEGLGVVTNSCSRDCRVELVETIPEGLEPSSERSIADSWLHMLGKAESSVRIAAFYLTLQGDNLESGADPLDALGREVFEQLKQLPARGVNLQIAVNSPQKSTQDASELAAAGADVREVNLQALTGGIIHTKLWVVDEKHLYVGSANMDWRSLNEVKEVGLWVEDCSCLAKDAARIFDLYWLVGGMKNGSLPPFWPSRLSALSSSKEPLQLTLNGLPAQVYLSSAPPQISARGRSDDLTTILSVIAEARSFVFVSVMDFLPLSKFSEPPRFWPAIDSALRAAAYDHKVKVRLLVSCWPYSSPAMFTFLRSLVVLNKPHMDCDIQVKVFTVPSTAAQLQIPHARVNHAKYMVTDRVLYIGTSNWSEDYFTQTAGVGVVVNQTGSTPGDDLRSLRNQAEELFLRDWNSEHAAALSADDADICSRARR